MTRAEQTKAALTYMKWDELLIESNEIGDAYEQDYDNEITWFEYADKSVACFHGITKEIYVYGMRDQ